VNILRIKSFNRDQSDTMRAPFFRLLAAGVAVSGLSAGSTASAAAPACARAGGSIPRGQRGRLSVSRGAQEGLRPADSAPQGRSRRFIAI
jgi:hypothetical protein